MRRSSIDNYLRLLAFMALTLKGAGIAQMDKPRIAALPTDAQICDPASGDAVLVAQAAARPGHVKGLPGIRRRAWRRPLTEQEKQSLRSFYDKTISADPDHPKAIRALLARIQIAPQFLYRVEQVSNAAPGNQAEIAAD